MTDDAERECSQGEVHLLYPSYSFLSKEDGLWLPPIGGAGDPIGPSAVMAGFDAIVCLLYD